MEKKIILVAVSLLLVIVRVSGQDGYSLKILGDESGKFHSDWNENFVKDSLTAVNVINNRLQQLINEGYFLASLDSVSILDDKIEATIFLGSKTESILVTRTNLPPNEAKRFSLEDRRLPRRLERTSSSSIQSKILNYYQSIGYPFATVNYSDFEKRSKSISCAISLNPGRRIFFDTLNIQSLIGPILNCLMSFWTLNAARLFMGLLLHTL